MHSHRVNSLEHKSQFFKIRIETVPFNIVVFQWVKKIA